MPKPTLLAAPDSSDSEINLRQVVADSDSDEEARSMREGGEDEMSESSEEALLDFNDKFTHEADRKFIQTTENNIPQLKLARKAQQGEIDVIFEYSQPSEAYYHTIKALLGQYLDGEEQEALDTMSLADHICERASIGQVIVSPLDETKDPDVIPELQKLNDEDFAKAAAKLNAERDVFGFCTILSLNYQKLRKQPQPEFMQQITSYCLKKADAYCSQAAQFKTILASKNVGLLITERFINLPSEVIPNLHSDLPEDLQWTKKQDDIKDIREFDYQYLLVISKYTIPTGKQSQKRQKQTPEDNRMYYHIEDKIFWPEAEASFTFMTTFRYVDDAGKKQSVQGNQGGPETQYKLVYLIRFDQYVKKLPVLQKLIAM